MTAKELFKKLNYFQSSYNNEDELVYNLHSTDIEKYRYISFNKIFRYIEMDDWTENFQLSIKELKAINKQIEEFGWNKEDEKKIPKNLSILTFSDLIDMSKEDLVDVIKVQRFKINEILDYLESKGE